MANYEMYAKWADPNIEVTVRPSLSEEMVLEIGRVLCSPRPDCFGDSKSMAASIEVTDAISEGVSAFTLAEVSAGIDDVVADMHDVMNPSNMGREHQVTVVTEYDGEVYTDVLGGQRFQLGS